LFAKEVRELFASRAFWLMLLIAGVLVGHAFVTAVNTYAEMSGSGGAPAALPQALTTLDGIIVPTWGAYDLAATLLFPFVAIRLIATEKESGALKLLLQLPGGIASKLCAKALALILGWVVAWIPGLIAILLWKSYGGHVDSTETINLVFGHLLRGLLSAGLAVAAAGLAESAASAAIIT
jgi:ABC-type transport system involved in multi-copper enzyme maturation permease subunit